MGFLSKLIDRFKRKDTKEEPAKKEPIKKESKQKPRPKPRNLILVCYGETIKEYRPNVLKNEVSTDDYNIFSIFCKHNVYIFGYGSLLYTFGWKNRGLKELPRRGSLIECKLMGYERGPFGLNRLYNFYGIVRNKDKWLNGVLLHIKSSGEWKAVMSTEAVAGLQWHDLATYRVVDVTEGITGVELEPGAVVHAVCCRPVNKIDFVHTYVRKWYYDDVYAGVWAERTDKFQDEFLKTGGFKSDEEVSTFIKLKKKQCNAK
ncbi:MAG: hypothetical protein PVG39_04780 [Desulfobacteraceae bacterium]|jgi:hypothetical protein